MTTAYHVDEVYLRHRNPEGHPERAGRIEALLALAGRAHEIGVTAVPATRRATLDELSSVHARDYVEAIASTAGHSHILDADTFTAPESFDVASYAVGSVLDLVDRVFAREFDNAFAALRPPGHHAETERAMGFCLFNNAAIAAAHALSRHGVERVLVVDWDVHHGNGTQEIFWSDGRVLVVSLHQFPFYPGTGAAEEVGGGDGRGRTVNIPLPGGFGDDEWGAAFDRVVVPIAHAFAPQLVLVSAGFDAHMADPLGGMRVTEQGFAAFADAVLEIAREHADGRLIAVLEGGYDVLALSASVETVLRRFSAAGGAETGPPRRPPRGGDATGPAAAANGSAPPAQVGVDRFGEVFARIQAAQSPYWKL